MIYTLTVNPSVDYIAGVKNFEKGKVNRTDYEKIMPGGKGINVSCVLKNLGSKTCALGFVAGFTGEKIEQMLIDFGVETDFVHLKNGFSRINVKLKSDEETEINGSGPEISDDNISELMSKIKNLNENDILVLAGSIPKNLGEDFYSEIMKNTYSKNVKFVVDCEKNILINTLKYKPFLIKPNNFELQDIFETEIKTKEETAEYAKKLQSMGAQNVLVSMGKEGGVLVDENGKVYYCNSPKGKLVNSTGAGDSVVAGFINEYEISKDYKKAFLMGICAGSASAFSEELATKEEIINLYEKIIIEN